MLWWDEDQESLTEHYLVRILAELKCANHPGETVHVEDLKPKRRQPKPAKVSRSGETPDLRSIEDLTDEEWANIASKTAWATRVGSSEVYTVMPPEQQQAIIEKARP